MDDALDAIRREFAAMETRPAVFDRELRQHHNRWRLAESVPVDEIIERFARHGGFDADGANVTIPLHEVDSAELTGEYVVYYPEHVVECVGYYEYEKGDLTHIRIENFAETYPAWRLRFWSDAYVPEYEPSYLHAHADLAADDDGGGAAPGSTVSGLRSVDGEDLFEQLTSFVEREKEAEREQARQHFAELSPERYCREYGGVTGVAAAGREVGEYGEQIVRLRVPREDEDPADVGDATAGGSDGDAAPADGAASDASAADAASAGADAEDAGAQYTNWEGVPALDVRDADGEEIEPADLAEMTATPPEEAGDDADDPSEGTAEPTDAGGDGDANASDDASDESSDGDERDEDDDFDARDHGLYPGSEVIVARVDGEGEGFPVEAELYDVDGRTLELGVYWRRTDDKGAAESAFGADSDATFVVAELLNVVPYDRQWDAIEAIEGDDRKAAILEGSHDCSFRDATDVDVRTGDLNEYQARAARSALRAEDVFCIHGPPGTGKTRTLTKLIAEAVRNHQRVLAVAHSNQAVDNLLVGSSTREDADPRSLHALAQDDELSMARVGTNSDHPVVEEAYVGADHWQADVVGATMSGAHQFRDDQFDLVVVDEATQATIPATLIPFSKGERVVLAGDHKQLPPYHSGERHDDEEMEKSLFEHLLEVYGDDLKTTLATQYRMHQEIAAFPNEAFYDGRLSHNGRNRTWTIGTLDPLVAVDVEGTEERTPRESIYNPAEVDAVVAEVERLLRHGVDPTEIGVIAPYNGQVAKIRSALVTHERDGLHHDVDVNTVDAFQGSEREVLVVSFVRSNDDGHTGFLDFPNEGPRRLNVALTRAKKRLVLVGDWSTLTTVPSGTAPEDCATPVFQDLYAHLTEHARIESVEQIEADAAGRPD